MSELSHSSPSASSVSAIYRTGGIAKVSAIISAVGVVFFIGL